MKLKKFVIVLIICLILFIVGIIVDSFIVSMLAIIILVTYLLIQYFKRSIAKSRDKKVSEVVTKNEIKRHQHYTFVAGVHYHEDEVNKLFEQLSQYGEIVENDDFNLTRKQFIDEIGFDEKVFNYEDVLLDCIIEPEPTNPHDKNALKVYVSTNANNWFHVGYIPKRDIEEVRSALLKKEKFECIWKGIQYRLLEDEDEPFKEGSQIYFEITWWA